MILIVIQQLTIVTIFLVPIACYSHSIILQASKLAHTV